MPSSNSNLKPQTSNLGNPRVAIVHDWLIGGGAEKVVEALHQLYPDAPIYTSYASSEWRKRLHNKVVTGYLQHWPFSKLRKYIPFLRIWWFQSLNFDEYELVISSSGAEAKGIKTGKNTLHVNYCHAPTHYYWSRYDDYLAHPGFGIFNPLARLGLKLLVEPLRKWDFRAAQRPDIVIANSTYTQKQIKKYYKRDSKVIFPPVDIQKFKPAGPATRRGFVIAGRQTPYKRFDLAVQACTLASKDLLVIGNGPENARLRKLAGPTITFKTNASDPELIKAFQTAEAFIFPGLDDFGIVAVEALAAGCPVIAYKDGGALDYVIPGKTGQFFDAQNAKSLATVIQTFTPIAVRQLPIKVSSSDFKKRFQDYLAARHV